MNWDEVSIAYGVFFWGGEMKKAGRGDRKKAKE